MGIGKIARGAGKVGLLIEGLGYIAMAGRALVKSLKGTAQSDPDAVGGAPGSIEGHRPLRGEAETSDRKHAEILRMD